MIKDLVDLKLVREQIGVHQRLIDQRQAELDASLASTHKTIADLKALQADLEERINRTALAGFAHDGEKKRNDWVTVKEFARVDYIEEEALEWAKGKGVALKLDASAFKKVAKTDVFADIPAEVVTEPRATIARDLGGLS